MPKFIGLVFLLLFFSFNSSANDPIVNHASELPRYLLVPGDVLEVSVWQEEGLQKQVLVAPDGTISFPLAGIFQAAGRTLIDVQKELEKRLASYLAEPVVNVSLLQNNGNVIFVIGKVNQPGQFMVQRPVDVMQALSLAGGLTPFADSDDIKILRRNSNKLQVFEFDYDDVSNGEKLRQNIILQAGDTVVVP
ncbi:MAG TPA: polysaccharide export protein [Gammaproteobacteria bacterium]|nr:polysaccharide export protein [Gammaproteobacteria bacterium]